MTLFAVACAGMFPLLHLGRPWLFYWLFPYPNTMGIQPKFRSPLVWDVFAVSTYATVSLLFWFVGLMPDLATLRDRAKNRCVEGHLRHAVHGLARFGAGTGRSRKRRACCWPVWRRRWCFRCTRWSASTSPSPSFPAGTARSSRPTSSRAPSIPVSPWCWRWRFRCARSIDLKGLITDKHLDNCGKVMLATGLIVAYAYIMETFTAWYSGNVYEQQAFWNRMTGPYAGYYWFLSDLQHRRPASAVVQEDPQQPGAGCSSGRSSC